jgi:hypothetical protein
MHRFAPALALAPSSPAVSPPRLEFFASCLGPTQAYVAAPAPEGAGAATMDGGGRDARLRAEHDEMALTPVAAAALTLATAAALTPSAAATLTQAAALTTAAAPTLAMPHV